MNKLQYKFEDGTVVTTLAAAREKKEESGMNWETIYVYEPVPADKDIQDGVDWEKAGSVRVAVGLKQVDTGNLAARGFYKTTPESLRKQREESYRRIAEREAKEAEAKRIKEEKEAKKKAKENA